MNAKPDCSLIVSLYNQARQAMLVLDSIARQTHQNFEVILADDGSSDNLEAVIDAFGQQHAHPPLKHLWHEDKGFRKTIILNKAFRAAQADYLIVVDGDMILDERFIEYHLRYRHPEQVLCGYRGVKLGERYSEALLSGRQAFYSNLFAILWHGLRGELANPWRGLRLHNSLLRRLAVPHRENLSGCNFSLYKRTLEQVNGMDETILEYGYEDFNLGHRLKRCGIQLRNVSKCCNTYHLYHSKAAARDNTKIKERIMQSPHAQCRYGLRELASGSSHADFTA